MSAKRLRYLAAVAVTLGLVACGNTDSPAPAEPSAAEPSPVVSTSVAPSGEPSPSDGAPSIDDLLHDRAATVAEEYLAVRGFSRDGLIDQIANAEGIPADVAATAIDTLDVDWNEQAVRVAEMYTGEETMTRDQLVQQLTSSFDRFTQVQAEHAADQVG